MGWSDTARMSAPASQPAAQPVMGRPVHEPPEPPPGPMSVVTSAFLWAAAGYALAVWVGIVLCVLLAISGPAFSITTPLFTLNALNTGAGKQTSFSLNTVAFCLAAAGCGAFSGALRLKISSARARRRSR